MEGGMEHVIMDAEGMRRTFVRLAHEIDGAGSRRRRLVARRDPAGRGVRGKRRMQQCVSGGSGRGGIAPCGGVDIGMQRDDLVSAFFLPEYTRNNRLDFSVAGKTVVLCDDVLHTGRTVRAAIESGVPAGAARAPMRLLELVDRGGQGTARPRRFRGQKRPDRPRANT